MSTTVEKRVAEFGAELSFNNQQFEQAAQTSINTLGRLKEALKFKGSDQAFEKITKASESTNLSKIETGVDRLTKRFSTLGIVGMTNIMDLTRHVRSNLLTAINSVTSKIVQGGKRRAMNVEQARFLLQGLRDDSKEIEEIMTNAKDSVTDTAYGYDQAAMAAAQFATSGVKAGEQMKRTLAGVAGVAATTNSEYSSISTIFTQVAGKGRLMGDELLQLSTRGLNAAAIIANYFNNVQNGSVEATESVRASIKELTNGLQVTEGEIREWTSKGEINFDVFASAMAETFGKHAKDANKTLTGVLSNVNARFSQIGEKFYTPLIAQEGPLVNFFNIVKDKLAEVRDNVQPLADLVDGAIIKGLSGLQEKISAIPVKEFFETLNQGITTLKSGLSPGSVITKGMMEGLGLNETQLDAFTTAIKHVAEEHGIAIDKMIEADGSFLDTLKHGWLTLDIFKEALNKVFGKEGTEETVKNINEIREAAIATIRGDYGNGAERIAKLTEAGFDPDVVQAYVNKIREAADGTWNFTNAMLDAIDAESNNVDVLSTMSDEQLKAKGYTKEQIDALRELAKVAKESGTPLNDLLEKTKDPFYGIKLIFDSAINVLSNIPKIAGAAKKAFSEVFPPILFAQIAGFILNINTLSKSLVLNDKSISKLQRTFRGLFSVAKILGTALLSIGRVALPLIAKVGNGAISVILSITATIGDFIFALSNSITKTKLFDKIVKPIGNDLSGLVDILGMLVSAIGDVASKVLEFIDKHDLVSGFVGVVAKLADAASNLRVGLGDLVKSAGNNTKASGLPKLAASMSNLGGVIKEKLITPAFDRFISFLDKLNIKLPKTSGVLETGKKAFEFFTTSLANLIDIAANKLSSIDFTKFLDTVGGAVGVAITKVRDKINAIDFEKAFTSIRTFFDNIKQKYAVPAFDKIVEFARNISAYIPSFSDVTNFISGLFGVLTQNIAIPAADAVKQFVDNLVQNGPSLESFVKFFQDLFKVVSENFKMPGFDSLVELVHKLHDNISSLDNFSASLSGIKDAANQSYQFLGLQGIFDVISKIKEKAIGPLTEKIEEIKRVFAEKWNMPAMEKVRWGIEEITKALSKLDPDTVYLWVSRITMILTILTVRNTVKELGKQFKSLADAWGGVGKAFQSIADSFASVGKSLSGGITKLFDSLSSVVSTFKTGIKVNMILKIAVAIGIVAASMFLLSKIPEEKYAQIAVLVLDIAVALGATYAAISIFNRIGDPQGGALSILAFAAAMVLIAKAMEKLKAFKPDEIIYTGVVVGALMVVLGICTRLVSSLDAKVTDLFVPLSFVIALGVLITEIVAFGKFVSSNEEVARKGMDAVFEIMVVLALCMQGFRHLGSNPADLFAPISFVLALGILALDIVAFALIPETWYTTAYDRITVMGTLLVAAVAIMGMFSAGAANVLMPLAIVGSLLILAADIIVLSLIPIYFLVKGGAVAITALDVISIASGILLRIAGTSSAALGALAAPIGLALGVGLLAGAIVKLGLAYDKANLEAGFQIMLFTASVLVFATAAFNAALQNGINPGAFITAISVAIGVGLLCAEIVAVGKIATRDEINTGVEAMAAAAIALVGVSAFMSEIKLSPALVIAPLEFVIVFGLLLAEMILAGKLATNEDVVRAREMMLTAAGALVGTALILSQLQLNVGMLAAPLVLIATIYAIVEAIRKLGSMDQAEFAQGSQGIADALFGIAVAFLAMSAVAPQLDILAGTVLKLSAAMVVVGAAFVIASVGSSILAFALQEMNKCDPETLRAGLGGIAIVIVAIGAAAAFAGVPSLALGAAFVLVGAGSLLFAAALSVLAGTIPAIVEQIKSLGQAFQQAGADIVNGAVGGVLQTGGAFVGGIADMAVSGFKAFVDFFGINSPSKLMEAFSAFIPEGAANGITNNSSVAEKAMKTMSTGMLSEYSDTLFGKGGIQEITKKVPKEAGVGVEGSSGEAGDYINNFSEYLKGQFDTSMFGDDAWAQMTAQLPGEVGSAIEANSSDATAALDKLKEEMGEEFDTQKILDSIGSSTDEIPSIIGTSISDNASDATSGVDDVMALLQSTATTTAGNEKTKSAGKEFDDSLSRGIKANKSKVKTAAKDVAKAGAEAAKDTKDKWVDVGEALSDGLAKGVKNHAGSIESAAKKAARDAYDAAKRELKSNSPSKKTIELGKWFDQGLAIGIKRNTFGVVKSARVLAEGAISTVSDSLLSLSDLMSSDMVDDPVIKPVLDLSDIQNGSNRLYSMMSDMDRYSLHGNIDLATSTASSVESERKTRRDRDNDILSTLIDGLKALKEQNEAPRGNTYIIDGITYDDGSNVSTAIDMLVRAAKVGGRA